MTHAELVESIKRNIKDKCPFMDDKERCVHGCWNCMVSGALLELLAMIDKPCTNCETSDCTHCEAMQKVYWVIGKWIR